ncbi:MAG: ABC transporter ATP-binding protein/permease [Phyllobacteriaceae bacterium]|nr:ABC transporter ATP-binding protein/permease [Phyllobacteriaceae bacterium]
MTDRADRPETGAPSEPAPILAPHGGTFAQVRQVVARMRGAPERRALAWLVLGLVATIVSNNMAQIWLNDWQGLFYDALERRDWPGFVSEALHFLRIAGTLLVLVVLQTWGAEMIKVQLRSWLTRHLLDEWLVSKRSYLLTFAGEVGANPDQRIHEDTRHLAELTADLGASLIQATLLLASFIGVLWLLSEQVKFSIDGKLVGIPGYMVWCALAFSLAGSALTWWVGRPMVGDNAARYAREADMRFALVRIVESAEGITLYGGEADERRSVDVLFGRVLAAMKRLVDDLARLTWVTSGYGWLALVVPVLVASPGYFSGAMSLGGLMMVVNSFNQVQTSLRWFVDNYSRIADWRATLGRVEALHEALSALDRPPGGNGRFDCIEDATDGVRFEGFELKLPSGRSGFATPDVAIERGEHAQIVGEMAAGKSTLFLAMAGLWSRGRGVIRHPPRDRMIFLPERPYFPIGSLAEALAYPDGPESHPAEAMTAALKAVGLDRLTGCLGDTVRWDRDIAFDEQQLLAFARVFLHRPDWLVMDDAMSALGAGERRRVFSLMDKLTGLSVIALSRSEDGDAFFTRTIELKRRNGDKRRAVLVRAA